MRIMQGKITAGLGQAVFFLSREGYRRQFLEHVGFVPFPGTLNVLLDEPLPPSAPAILIQGFDQIFDRTQMIDDVLFGFAFG